MKYQWDKAKAASNYSKHGVTFEMASEAFLDPFALDWHDPRFSADIRYCLIGSADGRLLYVAYSTPDDDTVRIISARMAVKTEKRRYHEENR